MSNLSVKSESKDAVIFNGCICNSMELQLFVIVMAFYEVVLRIFMQQLAPKFEKNTKKFYSNNMQKNQSFLKLNVRSSHFN